MRPAYFFFFFAGFAFFADFPLAGAFPGADFVFFAAGFFVGGFLAALEESRGPPPFNPRMDSEISLAVRADSQASHHQIPKSSSRQIFRFAKSSNP